jgi:hypothetical protein
MGVVNRALDSSEQKSTHTVTLGVIGTGITVPLMQVPYPAEIKNVKVAAQGLSGSPVWALGSPESWGLPPP